MANSNNSPIDGSPQIVKDWPDSSEALLCFGEGDKDENLWTLNDAFQGTQIFGSTGSGKSTGSGRAIAMAFLKANLGGLVLTAKTDEREEWEKYAELAGRTNDVLIFSIDQPHRFNFLRYERERPGKAAGSTENLVNLFCSVLEVADRKSSGGGNEAYWTRALKQLLRNAIDLLSIAADAIDLQSLYRIIASAAGSSKEAASEEWRANSDCYGLLEAARERAPSLGKEADFKMTEFFWMREFPSLAPETRSAIVSMFTSMADCFLRGMLHELFCTDLNFSPDDCFAKGKIIILDLPVKEFQEMGIFAQALFKYIWQRCIERRIPPSLGPEKAEQEIRPVFLWADESQFFVNQYDALFQSTARSSRACTVYLTQSLPGYESAFQSAGGKPAAESFLSNLQTKIFHSNGDPSTNTFASNSIGRIRQLQAQSNASHNEQNRGANQSAGGSLVFEFMVQPQEFTVLRTGGPTNDGVVDSIIFQAGRSWLAPNGRNWVSRNYLRHSFTQAKR